MKIAIGNDHVAVEMKNHITRYLEEKGYEIVNFGTDSEERADYPIYGKKVADAVVSGECDLGILICGDLSRSFEGAKDYWVIDASIATQNMILAANAMGVGSVWLGTWPQKEKIDAQAALFQLPETQIPHSIVAFGYPAAPSDKVKLLYEEDRVHFEQW